ncbi:MAG TPA: glycosyltransferase family 2 protein [Mycobacteriales bacterium]
MATIDRAGDRTGADTAAVAYILPLRWSGGDDETHAAELADLTAYLAELSSRVSVTVVDGSPPDRWDEHDKAWAALPLQHLPVDPDLRDLPMGKVAGVLTGLRRPGPDAVVIADDDVRWTREQLAEAVALLAEVDVVRPQNFFDPLPWHARWDTGRTLLNRAVAADWPGTLVVRRSALPHGYSGQALFENLELVRTVQAGGGRERAVPGLYVRRLPPTTAHFAGQRVRQAYDSFAQPGRLAAELAVLPLLVAGLRRPRWVLAGVGAVVGLAEVGRRRADGRAVFRPDAALWAPLWLAERAVCSWLALGSRLRGGVRYRNGRLSLAAHRAAGLAALRAGADLGDDVGRDDVQLAVGAL